MKTLAKSDKRSDMTYQKMDDDFFNKVRNLFRGNPKQMIIFSNMLAEYVQNKVQETTESTALAYSIALIDKEHFGTGEKATRLLRVEKEAIEILNKAYGHDCIDANGNTVYDGCGQDYLRNALKARGVIFVKER